MSQKRRRPRGETPTVIAPAAEPAPNRVAQVREAVRPYARVPAPLRRLAPLLPLLKVLLVLVAVDWWVAGPFFKDYIAPKYVTPFALLRERTGGHELPILLGAVARTPDTAVRVAFVGDSTMVTNMGNDGQEIPFAAGRQLTRTFPTAQIIPIQAGMIGLYVADAALWINQLLDRGTNVIVYGVTIRAFPNELHTRFVTHLRRQQGPIDLLRLIGADGGSWLLHNLNADDFATGLVHSGWTTYVYRQQLRRYLWERRLSHFTTAESALGRVLAPPPEDTRVPTLPRSFGSRAFELSIEDYGLENTNWEALELIGRVCERYAAGRCVLYAGPVNPLGRETLVEAGHYQQYLVQLRGVAERHHLIWRDYTDAMTAMEFARPLWGGVRDAIHLNEQGRLRLASLLAEPVGKAVRCTTDRAECSHL